MQRKHLLVAVAVIAVTAGLGYRAFSERISRQVAIKEQQTVEVPAAKPKPPKPPIRKEESSSATAGLPEQVNWDVPFTSQAPLLNWDADHGEACEEASALMVLEYFAGKTFASAQAADDAILELVRLNEQKLGYPVDQTAQQVAALVALKNPRLRISVVGDPTEASLKRALADGFLVIVPAAGRLLGNPYYQTPGPVYHMLVLRGYTKDGYVITNDPGTKRGKEFVYRWGTMLNAIHDWNHGDDIEQGGKVVILVGQYVIEKKPR